MPARIDPSSVVGGLHAVAALLETRPRGVNKVILQLGANNPKLHALQKAAKRHDIRTQQLPKAELDKWFPGAHQGVLAFCDARELEEWEAVRGTLAARPAGAPPPWIVVPSALEDPRNLGACIRTAAGFGVDAVLLPHKGACGFTPGAAKAAAGGDAHLNICRTGNLEGALQDLRASGYTLVGLEADAPTTASECDLKGPLVFVLGGEDRGIPPHVARSLHHAVSLPHRKEMPSFNASIALSLLLYEAARQDQFSRITAKTQAP